MAVPRHHVNGSTPTHAALQFRGPGTEHEVVLVTGDRTHMNGRKSPGAWGGTSRWRRRGGRADHSDVRAVARPGASFVGPCLQRASLRHEAHPLNIRIRHGVDLHLKGEARLRPFHMCALCQGAFDLSRVVQIDTQAPGAARVWRRCYDAASLKVEQVRIELEPRKYRAFQSASRRSRRDIENIIGWRRLCGGAAYRRLFLSWLLKSIIYPIEDKPRGRGWRGRRRWIWWRRHRR